LLAAGAISELLMARFDVCRNGAGEGFLLEYDTA
jgi:hypothetical protein